MKDKTTVISLSDLEPDLQQEISRNLSENEKILCVLHHGYPEVEYIYVMTNLRFWEFYRREDKRKYKTAGFSSVQLSEI